MNKLSLVVGIKRKIYFLRGLKVMLDRDLAELYQVKPRRLREQVKRNIKRFPPDFMFQLTKEEAGMMVSHFATPSLSHLGGPSALCFYGAWSANAFFGFEF